MPLSCDPGMFELKQMIFSKKSRSYLEVGSAALLFKSLFSDSGLNQKAGNIGKHAAV